MAKSHTRWPAVRLRHLADPTRRWALNGGPFGSRLTTRDYVLTGVPVIRGSNLSGGGRFSFESLVFVSEAKADELAPNNAHPGDLVFTQRGTLGQVGLIPDNSPFPRFVISQSQMKLTADPSAADALFLYYYFSHPDTIRTIQNLAITAGVPHINLEILRDFELPTPPLAVQRRIAGILSAYDDLIENCQRRIRVLDEMARALFREWFVNFRHPGHQRVPLVASAHGQVPRGWKVEALQNGTGTVQDGDWIETKDQGGEDFRLVQISNVGLGSFVETGNYRCVTADTFKRLRCTEVVPGDILVARMPSPIGRAWLVTPQTFRMITAVDVAIIRTDPRRLLPSYLAQAWNDDWNLRRVAAQASGTTRPRVTRRELAALPFVIPPLGLQQEFQSRVGAQANLTEALKGLEENLRKTRDLLLPRLMSGQLPVSTAP